MTSSCLSLRNPLLGLSLAVAVLTTPDGRSASAGAPEPASGATLHLGFEQQEELLADFVSQSRTYRDQGAAGLAKRELQIGKGRFGNGLHIQNGWPISKGTWNESGLDCDLIVAVMWGEWHRKPHYWGAGKFHGDRGTVAFWVKSDAFHSGIVFMQSSVAWGRKERDLFTIEVDESRRLSAFIRDVRYEVHRVKAENPTWVDGQWQHIAVTFDRGYGLELYHNGKRIGSTWGKDAWWQTPLPGLFSPFLPESSYDELYIFDRPLIASEVAALHADNRVKSSPDHGRVTTFDENARKRLLNRYADLGQLTLPELVAGGAGLHMRQTAIADCHDEKIPAGWVLDGRYELAWPHPYLMFTFILGDVDFHGTKIDLDLAPGESPNYVAFEGILDDLTVLAGRPNDFDNAERIVRLGQHDRAFHSQRIDLAGATALRVPLVKAHGSPAGLEGSARMPLTGKTRIHEMQLWQVSESEKEPQSTNGALQAYLRPPKPGEALNRYGPALTKLMGSRDRTVLIGDRRIPERSEIELAPLSSTHLFGPTLLPDLALDAVGLRLLVSPKGASDVIWCKVRDPANPSRIWAQTCVRVKHDQAAGPQSVTLTLDVIDLMLASEDRLWVELQSANGTKIILGDTECPSVLVIHPSADRAASLAAYAKHELLPAQLQYSKEYNYRPWLWVDESMSIRQWSNFGGPFDMAYPPLAVLRHDPDNVTAKTYRAMALERPGRLGIITDAATRRPTATNARPDAPAWAVWQRELYAFNRKITHWIASRQRPDGMFWGGCNDDSFIPLGYAAVPLMGDDITARACLRFYDGLEEAGIYADGYCDIWPIDPLHITDYIASRGLMLAFALGDPQVIEREMRTAERYGERAAATNAKRAEKGLPPFTGDRGSDAKLPESTPILQMEAQVAKYSSTHVNWYWGRTDAPPSYTLQDRDALARRMRDIVMTCDEITLFNRTEAMVHTDSQGAGIGRNELITSALGGRLQGRVEAHPHSIAVSWEGNPGEDIARLVGHADDRRLNVNLYNFGDAAAQVNMRLWRLGDGTYKVAMGADADDDGRIDDAAKAKPGTQRLRRFSAVPITVPPHLNYAVSIEQAETGDARKDLPDLAVSQRGLRVTGDGKVTVTVHNIGAAPVEDVKVELIDRSGQVAAAKDVARIDSPCDDFRARRATVEFTGLNAPATLGVRVRSNAGVREILDENNEVPAH